MLISSPRHKPEDLRLWGDYEEADLVHYRLARVDEKAAKAVAGLRAFAVAGPCYAATSWGKDSMVVAHLLWLSRVDIPLYHFVVEGHDVPETLWTRDAFLGRFLVRDYREIRCADVLRKGQGWDLKEVKVRMSKEIPREIRGRWIHGLRCDESNVRKIFFRTWGLHSPNSCGPIGWWSEADVFAHLAAHGLPVHPSYAMLGGGRWPRERLRVSPMGGTMGDQFGRRAWETEYYPEVLRRLQVGLRCRPCTT